ncbi:O-antigen ligase family protein [Microbacteriaceae bacterium VKM Ac-2855]|nr:O-antigen ligase family protein [Microbacteriaceae bacterium VKM Ac-2855]
MTGGTRDRFASAALIAAVLATIVLLPGAMNRWVLPKELVLAIALLLGVLGTSSGRLPRWIVVYITAAVAVLLLAAVTGAAPLSQLAGRWPRYEGLISLPVYIGAVWLGARLLGPGAGPGRIALFVRLSSITAIAIGSVAVLEAAGARPIPGDLARPGSLLGNATDQGAVGVVLTAVLAIATRRAWHEGFARDRLLVTAGLGAAIASVVLSASRSALVGLAAVAVLALAMAASSGALRRRETLRFGLIAVVVLVAVFVIPLSRDRVLGLSPLAASSAEARWSMWAQSFRMVAETPLLGVGPSGFMDRLSALHGEDWFALNGSGSTTDSPHDVMLQVLAAGGVVLLVPAVVAGVLVMQRGLGAWRAASAVVHSERKRADEQRAAAQMKQVSRSRKKKADSPTVVTIAAVDTSRRDLLGGALLGVVGYLVVLSTHFTIAGTIVLPAMLAGALVGVPAVRERPPLRRALAVASAAWVVVLGTATSAELPLQVGVEAAARGDVVTAERAFDTASALRPWDADVTLIAAQSLAGAADTGAVGAPAAAARWGTLAVSRLPASVLAAKALAVAQQYTGDVAAAVATLRDLDARAPNDPETTHRLGGLLLLLGDPDAGRLLQRAVELDPSDVDAWTTLRFWAQQVDDRGVLERADVALARLRLAP